MGEMLVLCHTCDEVREMARVGEVRSGVHGNEWRAFRTVELEEPCRVMLAIGEEAVAYPKVTEGTILLGNLVAAGVVVPTYPATSWDEVRGRHRSD